MKKINSKVNLILFFNQLISKDIKSLSQLNTLNVSEQEKNLLSASFCFLHTLKLYSETIIESLQRIFNLKSLFYLWQKGYKRVSGQNVDMDSREKGNKIFQEIKENGGILKPISENVKN